MSTASTPHFDLSGHVAIVTGANHGIGAATARVLAESGARVLVSYLRLKDKVDPGIPEAYWRNRASDSEDVLAAIRRSGGKAKAALENYTMSAAFELAHLGITRMSCTLLSPTPDG